MVRAGGSYPLGCRFESCRAYHFSGVISSTGLFVADVIAGVLTCVFATIALMLIEASSAGDPGEADGKVTLRHGAGWKFLAGLFTVLFSVGTALMVVEAVANGFAVVDLVSLLIVVAFLAIGVWMVREGRRSFVLDAVGIHFGGPACTAHTMEWKDVRSVGYSAMRERVAVRDGSGRVVRIGKRMRGSDRLWSLLEQHVAADIWSAARAKHRFWSGGAARSAR